jgi:very-short-patch-repair endonuclease
LRREATPAEKILWGRLRDRRFARFKFRRQHVWGSYILDFYCPAARLVVELDGESHVGKEAKDEARQQRIEAARMRVLRFWNPDVYESLETVLEAIWQECEARCQSGPLTRR